MKLPEPLVSALQRAFGRRVITARRASGGYTPASRWIVGFDDGSSIFVKHATDERTAGWLHDELAVYRELRGPFMAHFAGAGDAGGLPWLALEDLSGQHWPPPWRPGDVEMVLALLEVVRAVPAPAHLRSLEDTIRNDWPGWHTVATDPASFLSLGVCSPAWFDGAIGPLCHAETGADLSGDDLLHLDVRSDNLCIGPEGAVLVDWNWAVHGNGRFDVACWLPSLADEGGPLPEHIMPDEPGFAAIVSGYFAAHAGLPVGDATPAIRAVQRRQLVTALPWAAAALGLPAPDP